METREWLIHEVPEEYDESYNWDFEAPSGASRSHHFLEVVEDYCDRDVGGGGREIGRCYCYTVRGVVVKDLLSDRDPFPVD